MRHCVSIAVVSVLLLIGANAGHASDSRKWTVDRVTFSGNQAFDHDRLQSLMVMRPGGWFHSTHYNKSVLDEDINNLTRFYQQAGYLEAKVTDTQIVRDSANYNVRIGLTIDEGAVTHIEGITIFGSTTFSDTTLLKLIGLKPGDPFKRLVIRDGLLSIATLYADSGYLNATVTPDIKINHDAHLAMIDLSVTERARCHISKIKIDGLQRTKRYVVERELSFKEGDVVRYWRLMQAQHRLYLTGLFRSVYIRPLADSTGDSTGRVILVDLEEKLNSEFTVSVGYGSVEKIKGRTEISTTNLAGTARQIGLMVEADFIKRGVEGSFTEPRTFGTRLQTDLNLFYRFQTEPSYDVSRYGGKVTVGRKIGEHGSISTTYRYEDAALKHVLTTDIPDNADSRVRSLMLSYVHDSRDNLFNPTRGLYLDNSYELAGGFLSGTDAFSRVISRVRYFYSLDRHTIMAMAFRIGWMDTFGNSRPVPLNERFFTGGPNSMRGFGYQRVGPIDENDEPIGGKFEIVWNVLEIRRVIYKMFGVVGFVDVGNVWASARDFRPADLRVDAGPGLRANTPLGIVRLDYGVNLDRHPGESRAKLYLSMGQAF